MELPLDLAEHKARCLGSLIFFTQTFFRLRTGREFIVSQPRGRESHHIIICRELTNLFYLRKKRLMINVHPGSGKSELCRHFVAWALAHYPDSNFLYVSYSYQRSEENTAIIRDIITHPVYKRMFGVDIDQNFNSKGKFRTTSGGMVIAFGSSGSITGADAGLPGLDRYSGGVIMDDMHKPDEVHSDSIREAVIRNYQETISYRLRGENVTMLAIGQKLKEDDIFSYFAEKEKNYWNQVILKTEDEAGNILYPEVNTPEKVKLDKLSEYSWAAQHQQNPIPSGGGLYKTEDFKILEKDPEILATFMTGDTAETEKQWNDATVFSFWGLYKVVQAYTETTVYALHWLGCTELWCEPKDLEAEFYQFYAACMRYKVKPQFAAIEKKSTGTTLVSLLADVPGLRIIPIERNVSSGSKTDRFIEIQRYIASHLVSLPYGAKHTKMCIDHMCKITANNSHARDDIADTVVDAIRIALIDKTIINLTGSSDKGSQNDTARLLISKFNKIKQLRQRAYGR